MGEHGACSGQALLSPLPSSVADMKESGKDALPGAEGLASLGDAHTGNLARCAELAQSQASLQSASSVGSARGDEGAGCADVCGDYHPLFGNVQDPDNASLQGGGQLGGAGGSPGGRLGGGRVRQAEPRPPVQTRRRRPSRGWARAAASWRAGG